MLVSFLLSLSLSFSSSSSASLEDPNSIGATIVLARAFTDRSMKAHTLPSVRSMIARICDGRSDVVLPVVVVAVLTAIIFTG